MKPIILIICLLISFEIIESDFICEKKNQTEVKTYKIDLDLKPIDRFTEVTRDFKQEILDLFDAERKNLGQELMPIIEFIGNELDNFFPYPFNEEIRGIAKELNTYIGDVVLFTILYDITANINRKRWCTSILAEQENGQIIHGRNLDYDFPILLQKLVYKADFYRNGKLIFTSAQFAGYIGIATGHKHNAFTFSINERNEGPWWRNILYAVLDKKAQPLAFLTRHLMENVLTYNEAVNLMSKTDLIAPAYFVIGGVGLSEAVILTRNQTSLIDTWKLKLSINRWFLIETNYDHWTNPPAKDNRRDPAIKEMVRVSRANINYESMMNVLSIKPVCNNETAYSVVMSAKDDHENGFKIIIR